MLAEVITIWEVIVIALIVAFIIKEWNLIRLGKRMKTLTNEVSEIKELLKLKYHEQNKEENDGNDTITN